MRTPKPKKTQQEIEEDRARAIEEFNTFALTCYDGQKPPQPFFKLNGVQIETNYQCQLGFEEVKRRWNNKK